MDTLEALVEWLKTRGLIPPASLLEMLGHHKAEWGNPEFYRTETPKPAIVCNSPPELRGHDGAI